MGIGFIIRVSIIGVILIIGIVWTLYKGFTPLSSEDKDNTVKKRIDKLKSNIDKDNQILHSKSFSIRGVGLDLNEFILKEEDFKITYSVTKQGNAISITAVGDKKQYTFRAEDLEDIIAKKDTKDGE